LEATAHGLNTCWISVSFDRKAASSIISIAKNEKVLTVSPIGHSPQEPSLTEKSMMSLFKLHKRKPLSAQANGMEE
jgi:hypothetical protein